MGMVWMSPELGMVYSIGFTTCKFVGLSFQPLYFNKKIGIEAAQN